MERVLRRSRRPHPEGTRHVQGTFTLRGAQGSQRSASASSFVFDGMRMGGFEGAISYTFYPGSRLIQQEAVLTTNDPDVAYYYDAGLDMGAPADRTPATTCVPRFRITTPSGALKTIFSTGFRAERQPVQVRYRTLAAKTAGGSVAVFPAPHQYFFPRDFSSNLAFLWHRSWRGRVGIGVRQLRDENWRYYPWVNAPPGRAQRMGVFFLVSDGAPEAALTHVLRYTNRDRFPALAGYKTLSTHWHLADTVQAMANGAKVDAAVQAGSEGHGGRRRDDHGLPRRRTPGDLTDLRLEELDAYFKALKAQSDPEFLLIPAEEANVHLGGHWSVVFPKPVYWFMSRPKSPARRFEMQHPKYGKVYSAANPQEMLDLVRREGGYMYQTHPRTKGSTGFPDKILETDHFRDPRYLGAGWKAMPSDLRRPARRPLVRSARRLEQSGHAQAHLRRSRHVPVRPHRRTVRAHEYQLHQTRSAAGVRSLGEALEPLARGDFFTTTGEVLVPRVDLSKSTANEVVASVDVTVDVSASLRRDRVERRQDDAPRDDTARRRRASSASDVRMARARTPAGIWARLGSVGRCDQRRVRESGAWGKNFETKPKTGI